MHQFLAAMKGGHGHSHGPGGSCPGHSHGEGEGGGHNHLEMSEEARAAMLKQLEAQMMMMKASHGGVIRQGRVFHDPNDPGPGVYNTVFYGYGHDGTPPPMGWGSLAPSLPSDDLPSVPQSGSPMTMEDMMMMYMGPAERDRFWSVNAPIVGRLRIVKDRGGLLQAFCVILYWLYGNWSTWTAILLPYYADGSISLLLILLYAAVSILCITSFIRASTLNPGSLQSTGMPQPDWTECKVCMMLRPPKSHHCRRCGHCVRRMDHHCPWINNCVGEENQFAFMLLLLYAFLLSVVTLVIQFIYFFQLEACVTCYKESFVIQYQNPITYVCLVFAVMMLSFSVGLLFQLHIGVMLDTPTVERMKVERDMYRTGIIPDNLFEQNKSLCQLYGDLCGRPRICCCVLLPCRRRK